MTYKKSQEHVPFKIVPRRNPVYHKKTFVLQKTFCTPNKVFYVYQKNCIKQNYVSPKNMYPQFFVSKRKSFIYPKEKVLCIPKKKSYVSQRKSLMYHEEKVLCISKKMFHVSKREGFMYPKEKVLCIPKKKFYVSPKNFKYPTKGLMCLQKCIQKNIYVSKKKFYVSQRKSCYVSQRKSFMYPKNVSLSGRCPRLRVMWAHFMLCYLCFGCAVGELPTALSEAWVYCGY